MKGTPPVKTQIYFYIQHTVIYDHNNLYCLLTQLSYGYIHTANSKINNTRDLYRGINDFKKGYQPRTFIVKDEKGNLVADSHSIMMRWRNYFSQLPNVHGAKDVRQAEIHTAELLVPQPSAF
jgi:hypothetical protein